MKEKTDRVLRIKCVLLLDKYIYGIYIYLQIFIYTYA